MALNDVCPDFQVSYRLGGTVIDSGSDLAARRWRKKPSHPREEWRIQWTTLTAAELTTIRAVFLAAGKAGPISWTPPDGHCGPRAWRITRFSETARSAASFEAEMDLQFLPGVTPPV